MIFRQLTYMPGGCASYVLGCPQAREAAVVDPLDALGAEEYLVEAAERGLTIRYVIDTHVHADHVSAGRALAEMAGAEYLLSERVRGLAGFGFRGLQDGMLISLGQVDLRVIETPGHTPESLCLLVTDRSRSVEPWMLLSGDTLFVGDVGRPDLLVGSEELDVYDAAERAERLYHSIRERLFALPGHVEIYPSHFGGSACGGLHMSGKAVSTIGFERRYNLALQHETAADFADFVKRTSKPQPPRYAAIKRRNLGLAEEDEHAGA